MHLYIEYKSVFTAEYTTARVLFNVYAEVATRIKKTVKALVNYGFSCYMYEHAFYLSSKPN